VAVDGEESLAVAIDYFRVMNDRGGPVVPICVVFFEVFF